MKRRARVTTQPDYDRWREIHIGMNYGEVIAILGEPESDRANARAPGMPYYLVYGHLDLPEVPSPSPYRFIIGFDNAEIVWMKSDPFDGIFSSDGIPSKPEIIVPLDGTVFTHYPRVLDTRWGPVSGLYPMTYEVEFAAMLRGDKTEYHVVENMREVVAPYTLSVYVGAGDARVRVRGSNQAGTGQWSEQRNFSFSR